MKTSNDINEIAEAFSNAQGEMGNAKKSTENGFLNSTYSDLASVVDVLREPFKKNGLSFNQFPSFEGGNVNVVTRITHKSGQFYESNLSLPIAQGKNQAQSIGSAITYAKRYGLQAMAGVPSEDDDANYANEPENTPAPLKLITAQQIANINRWNKALGTDEVAFNGYLRSQFSINKLSQANERTVEIINSTLKRKANENNLKIVGLNCDVLKQEPKAEEVDKKELATEPEKEAKQRQKEKPKEEAGSAILGKNKKPVDDY